MNRALREPVLVTRAEEAANQSAMALQQAGFLPVVQPLSLLEFLPFELSHSANTHNDVWYVFTSSNAVKAVAQEKSGKHQNDWSSAKACCVGLHTAETAKSLGFSTIIVAETGVHELLERLKELPDSRQHKLVYLAGRQRTIDLVKALGDIGYDIRMIETYAVTLIDLPKHAVRKMLEETQGGYVFLYSSRTAKHFFTLVHQTASEDWFDGLTFVAISEKVAENVPGNIKSRTLIANSPNESSMINAARAYGRKQL